MGKAKYNIPLPEKKRRKAQKLLESHGDYTPRVALKLSRVLRRLAEGPEYEREEILSLFKQIVEKGWVKFFLKSKSTEDFFPSLLYSLSRRHKAERKRDIALFTQIVREK